MAETLQTRQVDAMGRVVIPKDIRDALTLTEHPLSLQFEANRQAVLVFKAPEDEDEEDHKILDEQGRLLIPAEVRRQFDWNQGDKIEMQQEKEGVLLQGEGARCAVCENRASLVKIRGRFLCRVCMEDAGAAWTERWQDVLQEVVGDYIGYCEKCVSTADPEDIHQARVKGRRLRTLLEFLGAPDGHKLFERLDDAHKQLGRVRERDVFLADVKERAAQADDAEEAAVFHEAAAVVERKRGKEQEKLAGSLPKIINAKFQQHWDRFCVNDLPSLVRTLDLPKRLQDFENVFEEKKEMYLEAADEKGKASKAALKALHDVRIEAKRLRYVYGYAAVIYSTDYAAYSKSYKKYQRRFGDINDKRDVLKKLEDSRKKMNVPGEQIDAVREQLKNGLEKHAEAVEL
ncbi:CHAD domain-containing protein [Salibacterium halotolerans]|uniref:Looped-hinge helix DNA binding domain-containing protein, AbrB family n=1 Tax=Salibacterium halotolerans TaxID=1884432 RepID=A0A1I5XIA7_9BACI|nr:CHAD domain-containing protein [Salibacterium halotolerans]SFQ31397.1 looped-hinge helix DNA binding domain-containing protein, AbrB family [Salibacterium halotolerans]